MIKVPFNNSDTVIKVPFKLLRKKNLNYIDWISKEYTYHSYQNNPLFYKIQYTDITFLTGIFNQSDHHKLIKIFGWKIKNFKQ